MIQDSHFMSVCIYILNEGVEYCMCK